MSPLSPRPARLLRVLVVLPLAAALAIATPASIPPAAAAVPADLEPTILPLGSRHVVLDDYYGEARISADTTVMRVEIGDVPQVGSLECSTTVRSVPPVRIAAPPFPDHIDFVFAEPAAGLVARQQFGLECRVGDELGADMWDAWLGRWVVRIVAEPVGVPAIVARTTPVFTRSGITYGDRDRVLALQWGDRVRIAAPPGGVWNWQPWPTLVDRTGTRAPVQLVWRMADDSSWTSWCCRCDPSWTAPTTGSCRWRDGSGRPVVRRSGGAP